MRTLALGKADPGGQVSLDVDMTESDLVRAEQILRRRGSVDNVADFLDPGMRKHCSEMGWGVACDFKRPMTPRATSKLLSDTIGDYRSNLKYERKLRDDLKKGVSRGRKNMYGDDDWEWEEAMKKRVAGSVMWQSVFSLLVRAQKSSIVRSKKSYAHRHSEYPSGGKSQSVMFLTSDGQRVEFTNCTSFSMVGS